MKYVKSIIWSFLAAGLLFSACTEEETFVAGDFDKEDCVGVYFPSNQEYPLSGSLQFAPDDPTEMTFVVARTNTNGAVTIPVTVSNSDVFELTPIQFADGEDSTEFTISFDKAEVGKTYALSLKIDDTDYSYVSMYTSYTTYLSLNVSRVAWVPVDADKTIEYDGIAYEGFEWYTDDLIPSLFNIPAETYPVKVEVREDTIDSNYPYGPNGLAGIYRMISPYGAIYPYNEPGDYIEGDVYIEINASDPEKVYIERQELGMDWGYGPIEVWSMADYYAVNNADPSPYYGKIENGAIVFPTQALLVSMQGGLYPGNISGAFCLVVNQDMAIDYSLKLKAGETVDGKLTFSVGFGKNVDSIKYAFYEGALSSVTVTEYATSINAGEAESETLTEDSELTVEFAKTGIYTFVAAVYDENGEMQGREYKSFGYVAAGDEVPVILTAGAEVSERFKPMGYDPETTIEFWAFGEDIEWAVWNIYETTDLEDVDDKLIIEDMTYEGTYAEELDEEQIADLNSTGVSFMIEELDPGTSYTITLLAFNGFESKLFKVECCTLGDAPTGDTQVETVAYAKKSFTYSNVVMPTMQQATAKVTVSSGLHSAFSNERKVTTKVAKF